MVVGMGSVLLTIDRHRARAIDVAVLGGQVRAQWRALLAADEPGGRRTLDHDAAGDLQMPERGRRRE